MAIYRAMLEDSINDLDTNNDGAKETKELMDVIDKQEINTQEVEDAQDAEFGPDDVDDILDETVMAIAESYTGYYAILESLAVAELQEAARSNERGEVRGGRVSEEFDKKTKKGVVSAMKQRLTALCTRILASINKLLTALKRLFTDQKALYAEKYGPRILKGGKKAGVLEVKGYPYDGLDKALKNFNKNMVTSSTVYKKVNAGKSISDSDITGDYSRIFGGIMDVGNADSPRKYKGALVKALRGADKPAKVKMSAEDVLKVLKASKQDIKTVQGVAKLIKEEFKSAIKALDSWAARAERGNARGEGDERGGSTGISNSAVATAMNRYIDFVAAARAAIIKCVAERARQANHLGNKYWRKGLGKDASNERGGRTNDARAEMRESAIENSFKYGYLSNLNLI